MAQRILSLQDLIGGIGGGCWASGPTAAVASATRTLLDLSAGETPERLTIAVDAATRDGLTSDDFLFRELGSKRSRGRRGDEKLLSVLAGIDAGKGGHSWLERELLRLVAGAGLPAPVTQQVIGRRRATMIRVDCRFPDTPVVVELLGYTYRPHVRPRG